MKNCWNFTKRTPHYSIGNLSTIDWDQTHNLTKAIQYAAANGDHLLISETMLGLSVRMDYFTLRNLERESMPLLKVAIAAARHLGDRNCEATCIGHLGTACIRLGMVKDAVKHYERAIAIVRKTRNDYDLASHLQNLGTALLSDAKDLPRAERLLHEALSRAQRAKNSDAAIGCLSTLGCLHNDIGNFGEAARLHAAALKASRLFKNRLSEGNDLSNLGLVANQLGNAEEGERMIREALAIAVEIGDKRGEGNRTGHLGGILIAKAERLPSGPELYNILESAREHLFTAMRLAQEIGDTEKAASWLMNLGSVAKLAGNDAEGIKRYEEALGIAEASGFARLEAQTRFNLGSVLASKGLLQSAHSHFCASRVLLKKMRSPMITKVEAYIQRLNNMLAK